MKRKGFAQIALMIALLLMAIAVPVATRLVQQNQTNQGRAALAEPCKACAGTVCKTIASPPNCSSTENECNNNANCGGVVPTIKPAATNTPRPAATNTPKPAACGTLNETCCNGGSCNSGLYCASSRTCKPYVTSIPTVAPTSVPAGWTGKYCGANGSICTISLPPVCGLTTCNGIGLVCKGVYGFAKCDSVPTPTLAGDCGQLYNRHLACACNAGIQCTSGYCAGTPGTCKVLPPTSTPKPTNKCCCDAYGMNCHTSAGSCDFGYWLNEKSKCSTVIPTSTPKPTTNPTCIADGNETTMASKCCLRVMYRDPGDNTLVCGAKPTTKPTTFPACIATSGQYCANGSASCTDKGNSIVAGSCAGTGFVCCKSVTSATPTLACNSETCVLSCGTNGKKATCGNNGICVCEVIPPLTPTPISNSSGPVIPVVTDPPGNSSMCPEVEACPNSSQKNLLQNCTPPDSDGTSNDILCNTAGRKESCGGKNYCCPSRGAAWTSDMSKCITSNKCTQCAGKPNAKKTGDGDCNGKTDLNDASIWRVEFEEGELGTASKNTWKSDFDCDGKVTLNDISIWRENFRKSL